MKDSDQTRRRIRDVVEQYPGIHPDEVRGYLAKKAAFKRRLDASRSQPREQQQAHIPPAVIPIPRVRVTRGPSEIGEAGVFVPLPPEVPGRVVMYADGAWRHLIDGRESAASGYDLHDLAVFITAHRQGRAYRGPHVNDPERFDESHESDGSEFPF